MRCLSNYSRHSGDYEFGHNPTLALGGSARPVMPCGRCLISGIFQVSPLIPVLLLRFSCPSGDSYLIFSRLGEFKFELHTWPCRKFNRVGDQLNLLIVARGLFSLLFSSSVHFYSYAYSPRRCWDPRHYASTNTQQIVVRLEIAHNYYGPMLSQCACIAFFSLMYSSSAHVPGPSIRLVGAENQGTPSRHFFFLQFVQRG
jgi:hypothetical protein